MESLLHWDFSPGLAIESQVRDKFQSTVHFSPANPRSAKEFFLVVSFSSASFPLTEESVALALQSCIGGISSGFRVLRLSDRRFRFSVASNRVGHFIYGLKDRIWPNFICHLHLYHGDLSVGNYSDMSWHVDDHLPEVRPIAIRSNWLREQQKMVNSQSMKLPAASVETSPAGANIPFGKFNFPIVSDHDTHIRLGDFVLKQKDFLHSACTSFHGPQLKESYWQSLPDEKLYHIMDGWQAGYSDNEVKAMVQIKDVPT